MYLGPHGEGKPKGDPELMIKEIKQTDSGEKSN